MTTKITIIEPSEIAEKDLKIEPQAFANEILRWCKIFGFKDITNLKLQKLLYYCYAVCIWNIEMLPFEPIPSNDGVCGTLDFWRLGPVSPIVYHELKLFGNEPIARSFSEYERVLLKKEQDQNKQDPQFITYEFDSNTLTEAIIGKVKDSIKHVLIALGDCSASTLVDKTHSKTSAWKACFEKKSYGKVFVVQQILSELESYNCFKDEFNEKKYRYIINR